MPKFSTIFFLVFTLIQTSIFAHPIDIERFQTKSGVTVLFHPASQVPMLDITLAFHAGSAYDDKHPGIAKLTASLIHQGSSLKNGAFLSEKLANTGATYQYAVTKDAAVFELKTLTTGDPFIEAIQLFSEMLSKPLFSYAAIDRQKKQQIATLRLNETSPTTLANQLFFETLYGIHPYAHPIDGSKQSIANIERSHIQKFYRQYFVKQNAVMTLSGAIDSETAHTIAEKITENLAMGEKAPAIPLATFPTETILRTLNFPSHQTALRFGQAGIDYHHEYYFSLLVGNHILGGSNLDSRLSSHLREAEGLTYGIYSQLAPLSATGPFLISFSTQGSKAKQAAKLVEKTLAHFLREGPTEEELADAKRYLTGNFLLTLASNHEITNLMLPIAFYDLPEDFIDTFVNKINNVSQKQIQAAFQALNVANKLIHVQVGGQASERLS